MPTPRRTANATLQTLTDEQLREAYMLSQRYPLTHVAARLGLTLTDENGHVTNNVQLARRAIHQYEINQGHRSPRVAAPRAATRRQTVAEDAATAAVGAVAIASQATRTFGVEIEFRRPRGNDDHGVAAALCAAGIETHVEGYNHTTRSHWKIVPDGSTDIELVSPVLSGTEGLAAVKTAMRVLRALGARVGSTEGIHVHVGTAGMTGEMIGRVVSFYNGRQDTFDRLVSQSRRPGGTLYCKRMPDRLWEQAALDFATHGSPQNPQFQHRNGDRYYTVNLCAFNCQGTIEFRQHQGSLNGTKVAAWISLLLAVFDVAERDIAIADGLGMFGGMVDAGALAAETAGYLLARSAELAQTDN